MKPVFVKGQKKSVTLYIEGKICKTKERSVPAMSYNQSLKDFAYSKELKGVYQFMFKADSDVLEHLQVFAQNRCVESANPDEEISPTRCNKKNANKQEKHKNSKSVMVYRINTDNLSEIKDINYDYGWDYYISKNTLKTKVVSSKKRKAIISTGVSGALYSIGKNYKDANGYTIPRCENNIFGLKNIVVDIDCHSPNADFDDVKDNFLENCTEILKGTPTPTAVYFSGRGFHIWYSLNEESSKLAWLYKMVAERLCNVIKCNIEYLNSFTGRMRYDFDVDKRASRNVAGVIRLFGTPNFRSLVSPGLCEFNKIKYHLNEIKDALGIVYEKKKKKIRKQKCRRAATGTAHRLAQRRMEIIMEAVQNNGRNTKEGCRNTYSFLFYNYVVQVYPEDEAKDMLWHFAKETFCPALPDYEIKQIIEEVRLKRYRFSNSTFGEYLGLTNNEIKHFKLDGSIDNGVRQSRLLKKSKTLKAKQLRNQRIIKIFASCGSVKVTAKAVKVCENTVRSVLKKYTNFLTEMKRKKKAARNRKIYNRFIKTGSYTLSAKSGKCCVATAKKIVDKCMTLTRTVMDFMHGPACYQIFDEIMYLFDKKLEHHNVFYRNEFNTLCKLILDRTDEFTIEELNIALAPYIML